MIFLLISDIQGVCIHINKPLFYC